MSGEKTEEKKKKKKKKKKGGEQGISIRGNRESEQGIGGAPLGSELRWARSSAGLGASLGSELRWPCVGEEHAVSNAPPIVPISHTQGSFQEGRSNSSTSVRSDGLPLRPPALSALKGTSPER